MEKGSWRARLARSNINILSVNPSYWVYEFTYHPKPGTFKWCKTIHEVKPTITTPANVKDLPLEDWSRLPIEKPSYNAIAEDILTEVLELRKELEG